METVRGTEAAPGAARTTTERVSDRELVVTRIVNGPARLVFEAWTRPDLFKRWWAPAAYGVYIVSHEADVRTGGSYRLLMGHPSLEQPMAFFGRYLEVSPPSRIVWTNEEADGGARTTVTFEDRGDTTRVVVHELFPDRAALDDAIASGSTGGWPEQFDQLDRLLASPEA
jgi:uncharacterized protein YndB with AHSA1/START domain